MTINMSDLIELYNKMQQLTFSECKDCKTYSCCTSFQCADVADYAKRRYGIDLDYDGKTFIIDGVGCSVPAYLRPLCTVHQCKAEFLGRAKK